MLHYLGKSYTKWSTKDIFRYSLLGNILDIINH